MIDNRTQAWMTKFPAQNSKDVAKRCYVRLEKYLKNQGVILDDWIHSMSESEDAKYHKVDEFISSLRNMPATKKQTYSFIRNYLRVLHGIKLDNDDSKDFIKFPKVQKINREPLTREIIKEFVTNANRIQATIYLIQSSSGMRISETLSLKESDFDFTYNPVKINIKAVNTKTQSQRITFISKEAFKSLESCFDEFFQHRSLLSVEKYFGKLRENLHYTLKYENTPNYEINIHAMRAFFRTEAGKINQDFGESMIGHGYLKQYIRLDDETKANYYHKLEPKLKIL